MLYENILWNVWTPVRFEETLRCSGPLPQHWKSERCDLLGL
jgi:hypothetical protein